MTTTGWNPDGAPFGDFESVSAGWYVMNPPQFNTEAKQKDEGPLWFGSAKIIECKEGDAREVGNELPLFVYDPMHKTSALAGIRGILARHGLSPEGLPLGDMEKFIPLLNELLTYGKPANVIVNDDGFVQDRFKVSENQNQVLVVFEDFGHFDLGHYPEDGGRYIYVVSQSQKYFDKNGNPQKQYRVDPLLRIVSNGPWQHHIGQYAFLNYTISAYKGDNGQPMIGPSSGGDRKQDTNFTRFLAAIGITNIPEQVLIPGGEQLDARVLEAIEGDATRPLILEWIKDAAIGMREQGHIMTADIDAKKGFLNGKTVKPATSIDIKRIGMPDQIPVLLTLEDAKASGMTPTIQAGEANAPARVPFSEAVDMYNEWAEKVFGVPVFKMVDTQATPVDKYTKGDEDINPIKAILVPYVLPILAFGSSNPNLPNPAPGHLGVTRKSPCAMTQAQLEILKACLYDEAYLGAVGDDDAQAMNEALWTHFTQEEALDIGF